MSTVNYTNSNISKNKTNVSEKIILGIKLFSTGASVFQMRQITKLDEKINYAPNHIRYPYTNHLDF